MNKKEKIEINIMTWLVVAIACFFGYYITVAIINIT